MAWTRATNSRALKFQTEDPVDFVVAGTQDKHGYRWRGGHQTFADVESVELTGQTDVDDDQAGGMAVDGGQTPFGIISLHHPEAVTAEIHGYEIADVMVVFDHHHPDFAVRHRSSLPPNVPSVRPA
jgi:hypothetical protein